MIFNVTYYLELHRPMIIYYQCKVLPSKDVNAPLCRNNKFDHY